MTPRKPKRGKGNDDPAEKAIVSYYTRVTFEFSHVPPGVEDVSKVARSWLEAQKLYAVDDVLEDFLRGWTDGQTDFNGLVHRNLVI